MSYIVLDLEWNQPWPGTKQEYPIRGEIIQFGAVRLTESGKPGDEFQQLVFPKYFRRVNKRVAQLTGISDADLREHGLPFPMVIDAFRKWCGRDAVLLTWGYDDIPMLRENLKAHELESAWVDNWYNLQLIFNAQTDGTSSQKALKTAMEMLGIESSRPAHDALGDAYHTAIIASRLDLKKGISAYRSNKTKADESGNTIPGCLHRRVFHGYASRNAALQAMAGKENTCPECKKRMTAAKWISQPGHRYMTMMQCPKHGEFFVRVRLVPEEDQTFRVARLVYDKNSEAAASYRARVAKPAQAASAAASDTPVSASEPEKQTQSLKKKHLFCFPRFFRRKKAE